MGRKSNLTHEEKNKIVRHVTEGLSITHIAKILGRDRRTIAKFLKNQGGTRKIRDDPKSKLLNERDMRRLKVEMSRHVSSTSKRIFEAAGLPDIPKTTRNRVLRNLGKVKKSKRRPYLSKKHKEKRLEWAKRYLKTDFDNVI